MMHRFVFGAMVRGKPLQLAASLGIELWSRPRLVWGNHSDPFINGVRVCEQQLWPQMAMNGCLLAP